MNAERQIVDTGEIRAAIAGEIRALRDRQGLSLAELGERAGLKESTLQKIESGKRDVQLPELAAIAEVLNISWLKLLQTVQDSLDRK
ncbi:hypothetical protein BFN03_12790 [Rhodococcus sp. WMMA185]|uniref:helix-turn-helix domain-containing protein n=1 Tax=Rhodococcus sp. WMMA185 TaxID=679318 RepID=UPI0008788788|nr:helix-turn-helix transcriptional regulator [Rhodococcus sp. WMMA185]AOW93225.1 hypothetical protein BFN03_12790 [Rhodococcus sp. WMMA185]